MDFGEDRGGNLENRPVFRFAPSPNGALHLGHAYSALLNQKMAKQINGRLLLRIEDIDTVRCTPALDAQMRADLAWLGLVWEEPVRRQSAHFATYREALSDLAAAGLVYKSTLSRSAIAHIVETIEADGDVWPRDPDGAPVFPGRAYESEPEEGQPFAWRLDMKAALARAGEALFWTEQGEGPDGETGLVKADPAAWGDVVLVRKDAPTSYHLSVVVDDALQGVTHVVRGQDLFEATAVHRLLQALFGFEAPLYHHHSLVLADDGEKLSKSRNDTSIAALRFGGMQPKDIARMVGI